MKKSCVGRQSKNRSKYDPQTCNKEQEKKRNLKRLNKGE
jgi:hypothetical protein